MNLYLIYTKRTTHGRSKQAQGILYRPDKKKSIDTYVDASFAGDWNTTWSNKLSSVMSRTGYAVMYANFSIIWCSKLQTEIALSTTKSKYIALSQALRDVIPLIRLLIYTVLRLLAHCKYIHNYTKHMTSSFNLVTNLVINVNCHDL